MTATGTSPVPSLGSGAIDNRYSSQNFPQPTNQAAQIAQVAPSVAQAMQTPMSGIPSQVQGITGSPTAPNLPAPGSPEWTQILANIPHPFGPDFISRYRANPYAVFSQRLQQMGSNPQTQPMNGLANTLGIRRR